MPLTKQYLRYVRQASFGVVSSRESNAVLVEASRGQLKVAAPALEDVIVWDLRIREKVSEGEGQWGSREGRGTGDKSRAIAA